MVQRLAHPNFLLEQELDHAWARVLEAVEAVVTRSHLRMKCSLVPEKLIWVAPSSFELMAVKTVHADSPSRSLDTQDQRWEGSRLGCTASPHPRTGSSSLLVDSLGNVRVPALNLILPTRVQPVHERHAASERVKYMYRTDSLAVGYETMSEAREQERARKSRWTLKMVDGCY